MAARNALAAAPVLSQRGERMGTPNSDQDMLPDGFLKAYTNPFSKENFQVCHMATSCVLLDMAGWLSVFLELPARGVMDGDILVTHSRIVVGSIKGVCCTVYVVYYMRTCIRLRTF